MGPQRRLFLISWLAGLAMLHHTWTVYAPEPPIDADRADLMVLSGVMVVMPWLAGPGILLLLRRMPSGGVNLPHAEYWFAGERRAISLDRLAPYLDSFGTLLTVFLAGVLALFISERVDLRAASYSAVMFLAWTIGFLGSTVWWVRRVMAAFPAPDEATRGVKRFRSTRRRR
jgi:hypothetical protein